MLTEDRRLLELLTGEAEGKAILLVVQAQNTVGTCRVPAGACLSRGYAVGTRPLREPEHETHHFSSHLSARL